jgi:DNA mismatch endonuclease, patch repair protein
MPHRRKDGRKIESPPPERRRPSAVIQLGGGESVAYPKPKSFAVSAVMRGNRKRDTGPELLVRRILFARGARYRVNARLLIEDTAVRPDIVFSRLKVAVFVDGCFWHGCPEHGTRPKTNPSYWAAKIARNRTRDARNTAALRGAGWIVIRAWEHEAATNVADRIERALQERGSR